MLTIEATVRIAPMGGEPLVDESRRVTVHIKTPAVMEYAAMDEAQKRDIRDALAMAGITVRSVTDEVALHAERSIAALMERFPTVGE